jgi:hypothetical protein
LLDAMYRRDAGGRPLYARTNVGVPVATADWERCEPAVRKGLREILEAQGQHGVRVFCPLGAGGHVDHIVVRRAVETLCEPGLIAYYEDYPYSVRLTAVRACLASEGSDGRDWRSTVAELTPPEIEARITAVACYASQLAGLFPSPLDRLREIIRARLLLLPRLVDPPPDPRASHERMATALRSYIRSVGGERYWYRPGSQVRCGDPPRELPGEWMDGPDLCKLS